MSNLEKFITSKDLERLKACKKGLNYFKTNFSNGAKVIDVIKKLEDIKTTTSWIDWLCDVFKLTYRAKEWYPNGQLASSYNYKDGLYHGLCLNWYPNGQLWSSDVCKNGRRHGLCLDWYSTGQLQTSYNCKDGRRHGLCLDWYSTGQLQTSYNYKDGKEHGLCETWHSNGQLWSSDIYKDGKLM